MLHCNFAVELPLKDLCMADDGTSQARSASTKKRHLRPCFGSEPDGVVADHVNLYGPTRLAPLSRGKPVVVNDVATDSMTSAASVRDAVSSLGVRAFIEAPLLTNKQLRGWLYVSTTESRAWTIQEQKLVTETVRRTCHAAERARAEERLREREARLEAVLDQMPVGVILAAIPDGQLMLYNKASSTIMGHDMLDQVLAEYASYSGIHGDGRAYAPEEYPNDPPSFQWTPMLELWLWRGVSDECDAPSFSGIATGLVCSIEASLNRLLDAKTGCIWVPVRPAERTIRSCNYISILM